MIIKKLKKFYQRKYLIILAITMNFAIGCGIANACIRSDVGPLTSFTPCSKPNENCPKPPSGPGSAHILTVPYMNTQLHLNNNKSMYIKQCEEFLQKTKS